MESTLSTKEDERLRTFNVGVIGLGTWGRKILEEYVKIPAVRVVGAADPNPAARAYCKEQYGIRETVEDYEDLLADPAVSAVHIATPNATHFPIGQAALMAGKHVLMEKPLCEKAGDAHRLVQFAESKNLTLSVGHIFRFNNALIEIQRLVRETFFGRIFMLESRWSNSEKPYEDRDVVLDLAPHVVDILNFLLGEWPVSVWCAGRSFRRTKREEAATLWFEFDGGVCASANLSWLVPPKTRHLAIVGENRSATVDVLTQEIAVHESGYTYRIHVERNNTIRDELMHFIKSVGDPLTETRNSGLLGAQVVDVLDALHESMRTGTKRTLEVANAANVGGRSSKKASARPVDTRARSTSRSS